MTTPRDLERRLAEHYANAAPHRAPDWILPAALTTIETTRQRRGLTALRRYFDMPAYTKLAAAGIAVIAVGAFVLWQLAPPGPGGPASPTPTASPTPAPTQAATATQGPKPTTYVPPGLTESFTSDRHGLSLSYPAGWTAQAATAPWTVVAPLIFQDPAGDFFWDPIRMDHLFLEVASQPLGGKPFDQFSTDVLAAEGCAGTEPVTVDGVAGVKGTDCHLALVSSDGRVYLIVLYKSTDEPELRSYDATAWFEAILATVQLSPEDAVDE